MELISSSPAATGRGPINRDIFLSVDSPPEAAGKDVLRLFFIFCVLQLAVCTSVFSAPTCSNDSLMRLNEATDCWNKQDYGCTKLVLEKVLGRQPNCAQALHLQSFVLERDGRQEDAERLRQRALELDPSLEKFWKERGQYIEDTHLTSQQFSHFNLRFRGGEGRDRAWRAVSYLNEAYNELGSQFGLFPEKKIDVMVFTGEEFMSAWQMPYVGGFYDIVDGKVRVRVDENWPGGEKEYRRTCRHEFTHAFTFPYLPKNVPKWFTEGIAEYYAYRDTGDSLWKEKFLKQWRARLQGITAPTLKEMHEAIEKKKDGRAVMLGYYYSAMFCVHVARERGDSWIPRMVEWMRAGKTFDQAWMEVIGVTPELMFERMNKVWEN